MRIIVAIVISLSLSLAWPASGRAQGRNISFIRDAEIEATIRAYARPIFEAAGLDDAAISIYLVNDKSINAFVSGGQNVFVHTGLLLAADRPAQVTGVLAHETGHITGGHLSRSGDAMRSATAVSVISILAGIAAMAAGSPDAGAALLSSSGGFAQRAFFKYTRVQEASADEAALLFLNASKQSTAGLIEFFERLISEQNKIYVNHDPFIQSHPLTRQRISRLLDRARASPYWDKPDDPELIEKHKRMRAKLRGFLLKPEETFYLYPTSDHSLYARYARAMAYHKMAELKLALGEVNGLLDDHPKDPYFHELKGQILFESGKTREAVAPFEKAVWLSPNQTLIRVALAQAILASEDSALNKEAIKQLTVANQRDPYNSFAWHQLAIAQDRAGHKEMADLATAESYLLTGRFSEAVMLAQRAASQIEEDSPSWWQAQDIVNLATQLLEKQGRRGRNRFSEK